VTASFSISGGNCLRPLLPDMALIHALKVLRQRYARGEIDTSTYEQMRERLEASGTPTLPSDPSNRNRLDGLFLSQTVK